MKGFKHTALISLVLLGISACGGDKSKSSNIIEQVNVNGAVEKGPFIVGSTVTINTLSDQGDNTGSTIVTNTLDDLGSFSFAVNSEALLQISSTGYYRNEITGELSNGTLTLRSIYKTSEENQQYAYVNLLTHLTSNRVLQLIKSNDISYLQAIDQAEKEFLLTFNRVLTSSSESDFSSLSIYESHASAGSAYLLAISSMVYQYALDKSVDNNSNPEAELTLLLNEIEEDFGVDGIVDDENKIQLLRNTHSKINPSQVNINIQQWLGGSVGYALPDINTYLDSDLDGINNALDTDDDNDGIYDIEDVTPYVADFIVNDQSITTNEDTNVNINISSNNPLGEEIVLQIINPPSHGTLVGSFPDLVYDPNVNYHGDDRFSYVLSQKNIISTEVVIDITTLPINDVPLITGTPATEITALVDYLFTPIASDLDNDALTYNIKNKPSWASFNINTGVLTGVPTNLDAGNFDNIIISVEDGQLSTALSSFNIMVKFSDLLPPNNLINTISSSDTSNLKTLLLSWDKVDFAGSYDIEIASDNLFNSVTYSARTLENLVSIEHNLGEFFWRVRTVNPDGDTGLWSSSLPMSVGVFIKYFGGSNSEKAKKIINTRDDGYIILAQTWSSEISDTVDSDGDDWIFKVSSEGEMLWQYISNAAGIASFNDIVELSDGSIVAVGSDWASDKAVALKLDENGNEIWQTLYRPNEVTQRFDFLDVVEFNNGIYVSSAAWGNNCGSTCTSIDDYFLHSISVLDGSVSTSISIPALEGTTRGDIAELAVTSTGNLLIAGRAGPIDNWNFIGAYFQLLDANMSQITSWNNAGKYEHGSVGDAIELSNGNIAIIGEGGNGAGEVSISVINSNGIELSRYQGTYDGEFYNGQSIVAGGNGEINSVLKDSYTSSQSTLSTLTFMKFDAELSIESQSYFPGFHESIKFAGLVSNTDGTLTFVCNEGQNGYSNYDIVLIKK